MSVLLDTHVLLWWQAGGERLSAAARRAIGGGEPPLVSPLSLWEIATLERRGRLGLDREPVVWTSDLLRSGAVVMAPLGPEAATWAGTLPEGFPGNPTDRLLYATAADLRVPLVTKDERLHTYARRFRDVELIW